MSDADQQEVVMESRETRIANKAKAYADACQELAVFSDYCNNAWMTKPNMVSCGFRVEWATGRGVAGYATAASRISSVMARYVPDVINVVRIELRSKVIEAWRELQAENSQPAIQSE